MRHFIRAVAVAGALCAAAPAVADDNRTEVLGNWYRMILELVRHTPTYTPPVASRSFAYTALVAYEATASGDGALRSLAGQVNGLPPAPPREEGAAYDEDAILNAALARAVDVYLRQHRPHRAAREGRALAPAGREGGRGRGPRDACPVGGLWRCARRGRSSRRPKAMVARSSRTWASRSNGRSGPSPGDWVPTSAVRLQQFPLLPAWGTNRPLALPDNAACPLPPPPAYSEEPGSPFHAEAMEVYEVSRSLTRRTEADRALLVGRPDAVAHAARALGRRSSSSIARATRCPSNSRSTRSSGSGSRCRTGSS